MISQPLIKGSELLSKYFDVGTIDGFMNGIASFFSGLGGVVRRAQTGIVQNYAVFMGIGLIAVLGIIFLVALG
jgi:NADH-quinone oxidoreductase subunit L